MRNYKYLIVGSSVAAVSAVKALRKADPDGSLAIISEELNPTYSRPLIYELLCKKMKEKEITFCEPGFFNIFKVEPILGIKALSLHTGACNVHLSNGEEIGYGKLLIATGGKPIAPPVQGVDLKNVFTFTSLGDVKKMGRSLSGVQTCLVIGGGLIGLQVSEAFLKMGKKVHIVELLDRLLAPILDKEGSAIAQEVLTKQGAIIHTSVAAQEILGGKNKKVRAVKLSNGEEIPADLVVVAVGVRPNTELVKGINITINKGIMVDKHMETSLKGIYAAGDVAEGLDIVINACRPILTWSNAYAQGKIAGANMAGDKIEFQGGLAQNTLKHFDVSFASAGLHTPPEGQGYKILSELSPNRIFYKKLVVKDDKVAGLIGIGKPVERSGVFQGLIKSGTSVDGLLPSLFEKWGRSN